jgi:coenzyme F420-reducing hydrogenase delta subunit
MAPPSLFDFIISRGLADGVCLAGCAQRECWNRLGGAWSRARMARERDPFLRERVPRERLLAVWAGPSEGRRLAEESAAFVARLAAMGPYDRVRPLAAPERTRRAVPAAAK